MKKFRSSKGRKAWRGYLPQVAQCRQLRPTKSGITKKILSRVKTRNLTRNNRIRADPNHKRINLQNDNVTKLVTGLKGLQPSTQFEVWMRMIDHHPFDLQQLKSLRNAIDDRIKVDIISNVPYEIALYIMSFLGPKDLCQAAQTCRSWRTVCEDNRLWREKCKEDGLLDDQQTIEAIFKKRIANCHLIQEKFALQNSKGIISQAQLDELDLSIDRMRKDQFRISKLGNFNTEYPIMSPPKSHWKEAYLKHVSILRNWRTREFNIMEPFIAQNNQHVDPMPTAISGAEAGLESANNNNFDNDANNPDTLASPKPSLSRRNFPGSRFRNAARREAHPYHSAAHLQLRAQKNSATPSSQSDLNRRKDKSSSADEASKTFRTPPSDIDQPIDESSQNSDPVYLMQLRCHEDSVITCLQFNPQTNIIVSGSDDQTLKVWSSETGECLNTLGGRKDGHTGGVWSSQLSADDIVVSGSTDRTVKIWNARTGRLFKTLYGHTSTVRCLALDGNFVVSGSRDTTLRLWDITVGLCKKVFLGHSAAVRCVEYKNDIIVSGAYDHLVMVWDAVTGDLCHALECHNSRIYSLQFDGRTIASGSLDSTICIWDVATGKLRHHLEGHTSLTSKMQLKGNLLVSANADSYCKVWDISTGECLQTLGGENKHTSAITSVYFNNRHVVTSSDDGTVKLWDVKTGQFIRNLVTLPTASRGGVVWRIRASYTKLICAVGSRTQTEDTHLLVLNFNE